MAAGWVVGGVTRSLTYQQAASAGPQEIWERGQEAARATMEEYGFLFLMAAGGGGGH